MRTCFSISLILLFWRLPIQKFFKLNQYITAPQIRLIGQDGKQIGIVTREEALNKAREEGVDLVEISSNTTPTVARLIEYKKFKYQLSKKDKGAKKSKGGDIKEIRLRPFTGEHDLLQRIEKSKKWLKDNNKVKVVIKFAGREIARPEFGHKAIIKVIDLLKETAEVERPAHFEGRQLVVILKPKK